MAEAGYTYTLNWCIPYLVGQPYRLRHLRRAPEEFAHERKRRVALLARDARVEFVAAATPHNDLGEKRQ